MSVSHQSSTVLLPIFLLGPACKTMDAYYCEGARLDNCSNIGTCTDNSHCSVYTPDTPACDLSVGVVGTCVECVVNEECSSAKPVCRNKSCDQCSVNTECGSLLCKEGSCAQCTVHADCDSLACLPDGSCASETNVAYVAQTGNDNMACSKTAPCQTISHALDRNKPYVKIDGTITDRVMLNNRDVTFIAELGAKLIPSSSGSLLRIMGTSRVSVSDLEITGAMGSMTGFGILVPSQSTPTISLARVRLSDNLLGGLSMDGGALTISQSVITSNPGGGVLLKGGTFVIVGNVFFNNGTDSSSIGGLSIGTTENAANRLEFNSFSLNKSQNNQGTALQCSAGAFMARNNIMSGNGTMTNMEQISGGCQHTYSIVQPGMLPSGTGNSAMDPMFVNGMGGNLHLKPGSPAHRRADPRSELRGIAERDIDGDVRTAPADIGADEVPQS